MNDLEIRIAGTEYSLKYKSYEIYIQGCNRGCVGCHNPEAQPFNGGELVYMPTYFAEQEFKVKEFGNLVERVYITGGDLLCQPREKAIMCSKIARSCFRDKELWLFTGASKGDIPREILSYYDVIKCGDYQEKLKQEGFPASRNQELIVARGTPTFVNLLETFKGRVNVMYEEGINEI